MMTEPNELVLALLTYIEQVEKLKTKAAFSVPTGHFSALQHELKGHPGVQFNIQVDGDDVWLRIPRLKEISAPDPDPELGVWLVLPKNPDKAPELRTEIINYEGRREVSRDTLEDHPEIQELFNWYTKHQWEPWATAERQRRKTIAKYNQLFALQQAISSDGAETALELVWGIGFASWKKEGFPTPLKYPLLVQPCEVTLNSLNFDLEVRPRDVEPRLEADCYAEMELPGVKQLEAHWRSALASGANRVNPFEATTYEGILKAAVGHLDPSGSYEELHDDVTPPIPGAKLKITNTWVLFGRRRSADIFLEDIRRLKEQVEKATELPSVIRSLVEHGNDVITARPEQPFRGLSTSEGGSNAMELYFPMPYNDEQVSIVQKLHANDGVVVQGPPGTGKTHTIANVICHYLAEGKRVLVTAKGESALAVLQEKLPERIRPLSVSLLSDERDGLKQFEHSIQTIATTVASINPTRTAAAIAIAEAKLNELHAKIANVDQNIAAYAHKHMEPVSFRGEQVTPEKLAKLTVDGAEQHQWFDDEPAPTADGMPQFDDASINSVRRARLALGSNLVHIDCSYPSPDELPTWDSVLRLHRDLTKARSIDDGLVRGNILNLKDSSLQTFEAAQGVLKFLTERQSLQSKLAASRATWLEVFSQRLADMQPSDPALQSLVDVCAEITALERARREQLGKAIEVPADAESNEDVEEAIGRLVSGKSAFALFFGKSEARKIMAAVSVNGAAPKSTDDWTAVQQLLIWRRAARKVMARWNSLAPEFGFDPAPQLLDAGFRLAAQAQPTLDDARQLNFEFNANLHARLTTALGPTNAERLWDEGENFVTNAIDSLRAHVERGQLAFALKHIQEQRQKLENYQGAIVDQYRSFFADLVGNGAANESELESTWTVMGVELRRLYALRPHLEEIARVSEIIEQSGAPIWAKKLRSEPASNDTDNQTPASWLEAWNWRQAVMFLDTIDGHHRLRQLFDDRKTLTTSLARTYQDVVAEKTWLAVFNNSPNSVRQALQAYLNSVQAMGSGTGVRAVRHRRTAREAMLRAYQAVPCWVLPQWRISESIPPEIGLFDLVVIDEASQSDIWALPALLRGRKVLVVGDHKQVSPSAVGTAEQKIQELSDRFLNNQPHGQQMTPDKSIYDLARVVFAGNSVMLKEHFRCVPAIIEFSNREFYQNDIKPLRLPKANERLDPPLVDVYVKGGHRRDDVNPVEAEAIVSEVEQILADTQYDGRSIGIVTLVGTKQAILIQEMISTRVSQIDIVARRIAVGPPPVFQGRERDIMMVSMVIGPGDRAAANKADMQQRFNVAFSRARDRMYLFRSVTETDMKEDSLNGRVLAHFKQPFRLDEKKVHALREKCESGFEIEMFDELTKRGYRVQPQVPSGGYRIDFVVEGNEGRRLAIECDGDRFHGPGQWQDDMARQRVLERAGWTFWRCFASSFVRRRREVLDDLMGTLGKLGIEPLGAESVDSTVWVHYKEVDPYDLESAINLEPVPA
jgi:very-short-patch-repair endonuclease